VIIDVIMQFSEHVAEFIYHLVFHCLILGCLKQFLELFDTFEYIYKKEITTVQNMSLHTMIIPVHRIALLQ